MDNTWFENFQEEIQREIDVLFEAVRGRKQRIQQLMGSKFAEEAEYQHFVDQHEATLHNFHMRIATLQREIQTEKRKQADDGSLLAGVDTPPDEAASDDNEADIAAHDEDSGFDFSMFGTGENQENPADIRPASGSRHEERDSVKKIVSDVFSWIYYPRLHDHSDTDFFTKRSVQLNKMKDNKLFDAVDILMRLPFAPDDERLWYEPLPRKDKAGKSLESLGERWYRFRLWERMLEIGVKRAEAQSAAEPDKLYEYYVAMKAQGISALAYLENMKEDLQAQIDVLQQQLDDLRDDQL
jgi:hypothetical protein